MFRTEVVEKKHIY